MTRCPRLVAWAQAFDFGNVEIDDDRRARDEQIAAEPPLALAGGEMGSSVEKHLAQHPRHPFAVMGLVENGLVRPLDPTVRLAENSRVIIVAATG